MRTEQDIRVALLERATELETTDAAPAPSPTGRRTRRLMPVGAAAATVAVVAAASALIATRHPNADPSVPGPPSPPHTSSAPRPNAPPSAKSTTLRWGFEIAPLAGYDVSRDTIEPKVQRGGFTQHGATGKPAGGTVSVYAPGAFDASKLSQGQPVTVNGRPGRFAVIVDPKSLEPSQPTSPGVLEPAVGWQYADDAWVVVQGNVIADNWDWSGKVPAQYLAAAQAVCLRAAEAVTIRRSGELLVAFHLGWLPPGLADERATFAPGPSVNYSSIGFGDGKPGDPRYANTDSGTALTAMRSTVGAPSSQGSDPDPRRKIAVNGHPGLIDDTSLDVVLGDGSRFDLLVDPLHAGMITQAQLLEIAQQTTFGPRLDDPATWLPATQALP